MRRILCSLSFLTIGVVVAVLTYPTMVWVRWLLDTWLSDESPAISRLAIRVWVLVWLMVWGIVTVAHHRWSHPELYPSVTPRPRSYPTSDRGEHLTIFLLGATLFGVWTALTALAYPFIVVAGDNMLLGIMLSHAVGLTSIFLWSFRRIHKKFFPESFLGGR